MNELETIKNSVIEKEYTLRLSAEEYKKIQTLLNNLEIKEFGENTIVISSNKNVVIHSKNNIVNIADGVILDKAKLIHLNPFIGVKKLFSKLLKNKSLEGLEYEK